MRDPCLAQGLDKQFHLVWTTGWSVDKGKTFGYASSKDLFNWSEQKAIVLMKMSPTLATFGRQRFFSTPIEARG